MRLVKIILLIAIVFLLAGCVNVPIGKRKLSNKSVFLDNAQKVEQRIRITEDNFTQLNILSNNRDKKITDYQLKFKLWNKNKTKVIRILRKKESMRGRRFIGFKFKSIENSKKKDYVFQVTASSNNGNPLKLAYTAKKNSFFMLNKTRQKDKVLIYTPVIEMNIKTLFGSAFSRIIQDKFFFIFYVLILFALLVIMVFITKKETDK